LLLDYVATLPWEVKSPNLLKVTKDTTQNRTICDKYETLHVICYKDINTVTSVAHVFIVFPYGTRDHVMTSPLVHCNVNLLVMLRLMPR